jgi:hypothetical protein
MNTCSRRFILSQNPMSEGFLQRWIPYKEVKHGHKQSDTTLHCSWSPHCCFVEQRTNLMRRSGHASGAVIDKSRDLSIEQTKTDVIKLTPSNKLHVRVAALCERIAAHIFRVTKDKLCVHGLTGYFKVTNSNKVSARLRAPGRQAR